MLRHIRLTDIMEKWHIKNIQEVEKALETNVISGLSREEAARRLQKFGPNKLKEIKKRTALIMLLDQFKDFMILVLIAAAIISGFIGEPIETAAIIVIVVLNAVLGFVQEYRAEKAIAALKEMAAPVATVIREGMPKNIPASELVPGDMVILEAGKIVPADLKVTESAQLKINEASLTGESVPVEKQVQPLTDPLLPLPDRKNMAYKGTIVTYGRGTGLVVATGMDTELGRVATLLQEEEGVKTPLQKRLASFGQVLSLAVLFICAVVFGLGILRGEPPLLMLLVAISLAVAAIPEALPAVVTISLAFGAKNMVKKNALIRKLPAVETLGSVTYICSDKTGTLTLNKMIIEEVWVDGKVLKANEVRAESSSWVWLLKGMALSNDAKVDAERVVIGDPTEAALFSFSKENGFDKTELEKSFSRVAEIPFDSERKCMTTVHKGREEFVSFTKGAPEILIEKSTGILTSEGLKAIDRKIILDANEKMAADGLRVLCLAMKKWESLPENISPEDCESELIILGLVGMLDPPRGEAKEAVEQCKKAGIIPVMITGDHPLTARTIAERLGILEDDSEAVITGSELERLSLDEFEKRVEHIRVYARVAPEQKLKIVKALQDKGQFACMTGDGVNDAPALKRADIGVAMGIIGTDVAKESAHMILLDDNFATIVKAVKEGRKIFDNIRKFIKYTMTSNSGEIWVIFLAPFFGLPLPLLPVHILWINLVTDGLPGLALSAEPAERGIMQNPPRHPKESIFAHGLGWHIIWVGLLMGFTSIVTQAFSLSLNFHWQTMVFTVLCLSQMGHALAIRSEKESLFRQGLLSNRFLLGAVLLTLFLQLATIYMPFFNSVFKTEPLSFGELLITLILSSVVFVSVEIEKIFKRRRHDMMTLEQDSLWCSH
ncbi:MAG: calcium-translocating P-type ATPase, PMCA-type [bacterium]